jgi:transcriptional regulator with XRE-family HTH domain
MFGEKIKMLREEKKMTQAELAAVLGVTPAAVGLYEQNRRKLDPELINKIADFFDVTTDYLYGRTDKRKPNYLTKEDMIKLAPEYAWLFEEEGLQYVELVEELQGKEIPPEVIKETIDLILKYRHLNK